MGFLGLYYIFSWDWAIIVSFIVGMTGLISQYLGNIIIWVWEKISMVLQFIIPNILLAIIFFFILSPLAILYRLVKKDPLMLKKDYKTFFINIEQEPPKDSFEKTW